MIELLKRYGYCFYHSFLPNSANNNRFSLIRFVLLLILWPVFIVIQLVNAICLSLDNLFFPRFHNIDITNPVFIVGLPRSGTTFLHRLLAKDGERYTTTQLWELLFAPSILQKHIFYKLARIDSVIGAPISRILKWVDSKAFGGLKDIHDTGLFSAEEDYLALMPILACFILVIVVPVEFLWRQSRFDIDVDEQTKASILKFYHRILQRHLYFYGAEKTYLSKNPSFTPMVQSLKKVFPDARVIACVRNPSEVVPSQVNSLMVGVRLFNPIVNQHYWRARLTQMLAFYYQHLIDSAVIAELDFAPMEKVKASPEQFVLNIYQKWDENVSEYFAQVLRHESERSASYKSNHIYSLESTGVQEEVLSKQFYSAYTFFDYPQPGNISAQTSN